MAGILKAVQTASLVQFQNVYSNPDVDDGHEVAFRFHTGNGDATVRLHNTYDCDLYRILEERNKLLPQEARLQSGRYFFLMNTWLDAVILKQEAIKPGSELEAIRIQEMLAGLRRKKVEFCD